MSDDATATQDTLTASRGTGNTGTAAAANRPAPRPRRYVYDAHPDAVRPCVDRLRQLYAVLDESTLNSLRQYKTIAIGVAVEKSRPETPRLVWTASSNWTNSAAEAWLAGHAVVRWDPDESRMRRGTKGQPIGAPGDAEQRMLSAADQHDFIVKAMAVSRAPCHDCAYQLAEYGRENGRVIVEVVPPPDRPEQEERQQLEAIAEGARRVRKQLEIYEGEHMVQKQLIEKPSAIGLAGYWVNHLNNTDIPETAIWIATHGALTAVDNALKKRDVLRAMANLLRARREYIVALRRYSAWKDGLEPAAAKAKKQIAGLAIAAIALFVLPATAARAASLIRSATVAGRLANAERAIRIGEASHQEAVEIITRVEVKLASESAEGVAEAIAEEVEVESRLHAAAAARDAAGLVR